MTYNADSVRQYFDTFADREWLRLESTVQGRTNYAVHKRFLDEYARPGMRVLDIGSGPGRFAIDLALLGADVTVADLSPVQLELARARFAERGVLDKIAAVRELDVTNLESIDDASYDLIVCYGGVLSYTRDRHPVALRELARVVRPGGVVLLSVISLYGTLRLVGPLDAAKVLDEFDLHMDLAAVLGGADVIYTRERSAEFHHPIALFTSRGLRSAIEDAGLAVEKLASANPLLPQYSRVPNIEVNAHAADRLRDLEVAVCDNPGLVDAGGHMIAVARRPVP
ncbi:MAG TPA: class I SAM-dependent methyltransferase [Gemmatimonadaceae bacterium]|nr:class I SAM-dependent methyltransferase [Gemmatimonadaceae bacterium]